jgi:hypothetical protein
MNLDFQSFIVENDQKFMKDVQHTLSGIPDSHKNLIKGYTYKTEIGNTLKGDEGHVGVIDEKKKRITIAAPWYYSREMVFLHEVAHAVWKYKLSSKDKKEWNDLVKKTINAMKKENPETKKSLEQDNEELFAMSYAVCYGTHKNKTFYNEKWIEFIKKLPQ